MPFWRVEFIRSPNCGSAQNNISPEERISSHMWKPTNQPTAPGRPTEPERTTSSAPSAPAVTETAASSAPRPVAASTADQATIGKSLVIKGEVTGSESLYIDGRVEGSINLAGNRVTVGRNGVVSANINAAHGYAIAREIDRTFYPS